MTSLGTPPSGSTPVLTKPQMTVLSCLYNTYGEWWCGGKHTRPAARLVEFGLAERGEDKWHRCTDTGARAFLTLRGQEHTYEGAAARRALARMERAA